MSENEAERKPRGGHMRGLAIAALVALGIAAGAAGAALYDGRAPDGQPAEEVPAATTEEAADEAHVHDWTAVYELVEVPAVTHVVHHDAVYDTETVEETVCNTCGEVVTGATREHAEQTGHDGFTTGVPVEHEVLVSEAWDETVVDEPASSEMVHVADECAGCGEVRDVPDEAVE